MKTQRAARLLLGISVATLAVGGAVYAQSHVMAPLASTAWGAAPPMLPAGAQIAVLSGDPSRPSAYAVRLKFPANYSIPAHSHPTDESVVVTSGELFMAMGDKLDKTASHGMGVGGYALVPAKSNHFAYTGAKETTIVLYGQGPVEFKYVNPSDDPRNKAPQTSSR